MPALRNFTVSGNRLSGPIPDAWAEAGSRPRFPFLQAMMLLPGTPHPGPSDPGPIGIERVLSCLLW